MSFIDSLQLFGGLFVIAIFLMLFAGRKDVRIAGGIAMTIGTLIGLQFGFGPITNTLMISGFASYLLVFRTAYHVRKHGLEKLEKLLEKFG